MPIVLKSGSLNLLEPSGSTQACNGIDCFNFTFYLIYLPSSGLYILNPISCILKITQLKVYIIHRLTFIAKCIPVFRHLIFSIHNAHNNRALWRLNCYENLLTERKTTTVLTGIKIILWTEKRVTSLCIVYSRGAPNG